MLKQVIVSAPGKLMLFGEHAVVYGKPSIVTAVNQRLTLKATKLDEPIFQLEAVDVGIEGYQKPLSEVGNGEIPKSAKFVEVAIKIFFGWIGKQHILSSRAKRSDLDENLIKIATGRDFDLRNDKTFGIKIETVSQFKSTFGFGSSSASAVCTIKALSELFKIKLAQKQIFELAYKTVIDIQGVGSGFDLAAAIYGGTLFFVTGGKTIEPLTIKELHLIVGYTGVKADTVTVVKEVKTRFEHYPKLLKNIYDEMELIVEEAKKALEKNDLKRAGELMDLNQGYLETLGVSSEKLSAMIYAARSAGAYGAKLSGAGVGDCMIAFAPPSKRKAVEKAIEKAGGQVLKIEVNTTGVRLES